MGKYIQQNLIKDEVVIYESKLHWSAWLAPAFWAFIFFLFAITIPVSIFIIIRAYLRIKNTEIAITNKRVIVKVGAFGKHTFELNLSKVESVSVHQGYLTRMLETGSVVIRGTGGTTEIINNIEEPFEFRKKFQEAQDN